MKLQPSHKRILEYLDKYGSANTFKLSRDLKIERGELISLVEELTNERLTKFRVGTVIKGDKELISQETSRSIGADEEKAEMEKAIPEQIPAKKTLKKPKPRVHKVLGTIKLKERQPELNAKEKIKRMGNNWLKKEEELKKDIEDLQTQRGKTAQKLSKEKALLCQIRKEKRELEKNLAVWESSLKQREESIQKKKEDIQKREESVSVAEKKLEREKQRIAKARALKKGINKLEATLTDSEKKGSIGKEESKQPKEKKAKPKAVSKRIKKLKRKDQIQKKEKHKLEKREEPKLEKQGYEKIGLDRERIEDTPISAFENVLETKPPDQLGPAISESPRHELEKESFPSLRSDDFEEPEQIKPTLKSKIKRIIAKIRVSKTETEQPKVTSEELWQPATRIGEENIEGRFHGLIEREISLLKQKRIDEAKEIHLQLKDMINEVIDPDRRKMVIKDWNRIKDVY